MSRRSLRWSLRWSRSALVAALALGPAAAVAPSARAGDAPAAALATVRPLAIGEKAPDLVATDLDGKPFALATARTITAADALAAVNAAARTLGAKADLTADAALTTIPDLKDPDLKGEEGLVPSKVVALGNAAGRVHGLVADEASVAAWKTVGDVAAWVEGAANAPIVFVCWSPKCPTSKLYEERLFATVARRGARVYALGSNATDSADDLKGYLETKELPLRVLADAEQKVTDVFGGKRTPHVFVLDAKNVLRYAGTIDNDAPMTETEEKRIAYLDLALAALGEGRLPEILMTTPVG